MYLQIKLFTVESNHVDDIVNKWLHGRNKQIDGLVETNVFVDDKDYRDQREVMVQITWESLEKAKAWRTHPDHVAGHKNAKEKPAWIIKVEQKGYHLAK